MEQNSVLFNKAQELFIKSFKSKKAAEEMIEITDTNANLYKYYYID
jgi:hypothetical protein